MKKLSLLVVVILSSTISWSQHYVVLDKHASIERIKAIENAHKNDLNDLAVYLMYRSDTVITKKDMPGGILHKYADLRSELGTEKRKIWNTLKEFFSLESKYQNGDYVGTMGIFELDSNFVNHLNYFAPRFEEIKANMLDRKAAILQEKAQAKANYNTQFKGSTINDLGWSGSIDNCTAGTISPDVYAKVLQRWKYFRSLTGVPDQIRLDDEFNNFAQATALTIAANDSLLLYMEDTIPCYSHLGHTGLKYSKISQCSSTDEILTDMIKGDDELDNSALQRRLLLNPETTVFGFGAAKSNTNTIYEVNYVDGGREGVSDDEIPEYLAYPSPGFFPNELVFDKWSFTLYDSKADFSRSRVQIRTIKGKVIPVDILFTNGRLSGRSIVWKIRDKDLKDYTDKVLDITIKHVKIGDTIRDFNYSVMLFDVNE